MRNLIDFETLVDISLDIAQVLFVSMFIGPIVSGKLDSPLMILGFLFSVGFWLFGLTLKRKING